MAVLIALLSCRGGPDVSTHPTPVHPDQHFIQVGELTISYFDLNPTARGLPLLFIHGYNGSGYEAIPLPASFVQYRIIAPHSPCAGSSDYPTIPHLITHSFLL